MKQLLLLLTLILASCASKQVLNTEQVTVTKNDFLNMNVLWIKDKGKKFDFEMSISNISENDLIVMLNDFTCAKGNMPGTLKHTFFNTGERTMDIRKGQTKRFKLVCNIGSKVEGDAKIVISRMFDNPNGDGATRGKQVGDKVEWTGRLE